MSLIASYPFSTKASIVLAAIAFSTIIGFAALKESGVSTIGTLTPPLHEKGKRLALIIANGDYAPSSKVQKLTDVFKEAQEVADVLRQVDFEIAGGKPYENLTHDAMNSAINDFINQLKAGDTGLVYYSGHGSQFGIDNYLLPVDADLVGEDIGTAGIPLEDSIITPMGDRGTRANIVILDACRDSIVIGKSGFIKPSSIPGNTFIAYAVQPNALAPSPSPFTQPLIDNLREPGLRIEDLFNRIRTKVMASTAGQIKPSVFGGIDPPFYFRERAYIKGKITDADDSARVIINNAVEIDSQKDHDWKPLYLNPGENSLEIRVYNQESYDDPVFRSVPAGWHYNIQFQAKDGNAFPEFGAREDHPAKKGYRHGREFVVARATIIVDRITAKINFSNVRKIPLNELAQPIPASIRWVRNDQPIPSDAIEGGQDNGQIFYVCHGDYHGTHIGRTVGSTCHISYGSREIPLPTYEILAGSGSWGKPQEWFVGALIGGQELGGPLYVCRATFDGKIYPGKVVNGNCNIGVNDSEKELGSYEVFYPSGVTH